MLLDILNLTINKQFNNTDLFEGIVPSDFDYCSPSTECEWHGCVKKCQESDTVDLARMVFAAISLGRRAPGQYMPMRWNHDLE